MDIVIENNLEPPIFDKLEYPLEGPEKTPFDLFIKFITPEIITMITENSNNYLYRKSKRKHNKITEFEMMNFILIYIYFSVYILPEKRMYWKSSNLFSFYIPRIMSYNRFILINKYFHLSKESDLDYNSNPDRLILIKDFLDSINKNFKLCHNVSNFLTIDECMASFQGRIILRQYMKMKKRKWGIKFFTICESFSGYVYELLPYTGKEFNYNKSKGIGPSVIDILIKNKLELPPNTHLSFDSFYTSMDHIAEMNRQGIKFTATFLPNRKGFEDFRKCELLKNELKIINNGEIKKIAYHDKRIVYLVSNKYSEKFIQYKNSRNRLKIVPEIIYAYNKTKSGVDRVDQIISIYSSKRKTYKWTKAVFFYLLDICVFNSSILYFSQKSVKAKNIQSKMSHFRTTLIEKYIHQNKSEFENRMNKAQHFPSYIKKQKECKFCSKIFTIKRIPRTNYECSRCKIALCVLCFEKYHLKK